MCCVLKLTKDLTYKSRESIGSQVNTARVRLMSTGDRQLNKDSVRSETQTSTQRNGLSDPFCLSQSKAAASLQNTAIWTLHRDAPQGPCVMKMRHGVGDEQPHTTSL